MRFPRVGLGSWLPPARRFGFRAARGAVPTARAGDARGVRTPPPRAARRGGRFRRVAKGIRREEEKEARAKKSRRAGETAGRRGPEREGKESMAATTADASALEGAKENVVPLKAGRGGKGLAALAGAASGGGGVSSKHKEHRRLLRQSIESYEGNDPLAPWLVAIKWTKESVPAAGLQSELVPLLEDCTKAFAPGETHADKYKEDVRYLRVWLLYADWVPEPKDIFSYLSANGIGQCFAVFYEAHATFLELRGNHEAAKRVYDEGIDRMAQPIDRLRTKRKGFEVRMAKRRARAKKEHSASAEAIAEGPSRAMLGDLRAPGRVTRRAPGAGGGEPLGAADANVPAAPLEVFTDDGVGGSTGSGAVGATAGPWQHLQTQRQNNSENAANPAQWAGTTLGGAAGAAAAAAAVDPAADSLAIFVDPEFEGKAKPDEKNATSTSRCLDACKARDAAEARTNEVAAAAAAAERTASAPVGVARMFAPKRRVRVYRTDAGALTAFDPAALVGADGNEVSFEERRVAMWRARAAREREAMCEQEREQESSGSDVEMEMDEDDSPVAATAPAQRPEPLAEDIAVFEEDQNAAHTSGAAPLDAGGEPLQVYVDDENAAPTHDARAVQPLDVFEDDENAKPPAAPAQDASRAPDAQLLGAAASVAPPLSAVKEHMEGGRANDDAVEEEDDTSDGFQIFQPPSPTLNFRQAMQRGQADDMTINTQEAMDDIMSMFKEDLPCQGTMRCDNGGGTNTAPAAPVASSVTVGEGDAVAVYEDAPSRNADADDDTFGDPKSFSVDVFEDECPQGHKGGADGAPSGHDAPLDVFEDLCAGKDLEKDANDAMGELTPESPAIPRANTKPSRISMNPLFEVFGDAPGGDSAGPAPPRAPLAAVENDDAENAPPPADADAPAQNFPSGATLEGDENAVDAAENLAVFEDSPRPVESAAHDVVAAAPPCENEDDAVNEGAEPFSVTHVFKDIASTAEAPAEADALEDGGVGATCGHAGLGKLRACLPSSDGSASASNPWGIEARSALLGARPDSAPGLASLVCAGQSFDGTHVLTACEAGSDSASVEPLTLGDDTYILTAALRASRTSGARVFSAFATDDVTLAAMGLGNDDEQCTLEVHTGTWVHGAWAHCVTSAINAQLSTARCCAPRGFVPAAGMCYCFSDASISRVPLAQASGGSAMDESGSGFSLACALRAYSVAGGTMPSPLAAFYALRLLDGMAAVHSAGFAHCGLAPDVLGLLSAEVGATDWTPAEVGPWSDIGVAVGSWERSLELGALSGEADAAVRDALAACAGDMGAPKCPEAPTSAAAALSLDAMSIVDVVHRMLQGVDAGVKLETSAFDAAPDVDVTSSMLRPACDAGALPAWASAVFAALLNHGGEGCSAPPVRAAREALAEELAGAGRELRTAMAEQNVMLFDLAHAA